MPKKCTACQEELEPGALFCFECGTKVVKEKKKPVGVPCMHCSAPLEPNAPFCCECGMRQKPTTSTPTPVANTSSNCQNCQADLEPGAIFCVECGTKQTGGSSASRSPAPKSAPRVAPRATTRAPTRAPSKPTAAPKKTAPAPKPKSNFGSGAPGGVVCGGCNQVISGPGIKALSKDWHRECFTCSQCQGGFEGSQFAVKDGNAVCMTCVRGGGHGGGHGGHAASKPRGGHGGTSGNSSNSTDVCTGCNAPMAGSGVRIDGAIYHEWCFKCSGCNKAFDQGEGFVKNAEGEPMHAPCYARANAQLCSACNEPCTGGYIEVKGQPMHEECFVCTGCRNPFTGAYVERNGKPFHRDCLPKTSVSSHRGTSNRQGSSPASAPRAPASSSGGGASNAASKSRFCTECGTKNTGRFCCECGHKLY